MSKKSVSLGQFSTFGDLLKYLRKREELTQRELAHLVGYSDTQISRLEKNTRVPDDATLTALFVPALHLEHEPAWVERLLELARQARRGELPDAKTTVIPNNLPASLTTFIGREKEQAEIIQLIGEHRLVTLTGEGGVGKTRTSLKVGRQVLGEYVNGVWLVELAPLSEPELLTQTVASVFGIVAQPELSHIELLINFLRAQTALLILDNCEHLLDACAQLTDTLLKNCPNLKILATSREAFGILGEVQYRLPTLDLPDIQQTLKTFREYESVRLFEERARLSQPDFSLTMENASSIAEICSRLDGIPLALELAAARVNMFSTQQIAARLTDRFDLLTGGSRTAMPRQQTLRASIDWSWDLIAESERMLLQRLAVFAGGWTLEAAEAVCSGDMIETHQVAELMSQLVAKSLVIVHQASGGEKRFHLHETIHQYALEKLSEMGEEVKTAAYERHSHTYLSLLTTRSEQLKGVNSAQVGAALRLELDNIRQGWHRAVETEDWGELKKCVLAMAVFYNRLGLVQEGTQLLQQAINSLELKPAPQAGLLPFLMGAQLSLLGSISTLKEMLPIIERLLAMTRGKPELARMEAQAYYSWSMSLLEQDSDPEQARVYLDHAFASASNLDDPELEAYLQCESGRNYSYDGQFDKAIDILQKALFIFKKLEHLPGQALAYSRLAPAFAEGYNLGPALGCDQEALRLYSQTNYRVNLNRAHNNLAETYVLLGAYEQAKEHALKSLSISREQGNKVNEINTLSVYAATLDGLGQTEEAEKQYRTAISAQKELSMNWSLSYSLLDWGDFQLRAGRLVEAEKTFEEALAINSDMDHLRMTTQSKLAMVYLAQGKTEQALAFASEIWQAVEPERGQGLPFPIKTMFECFTVFQACNDARAKNALDQAADVLKRTADGIEDPEMREAFLNNVPVNRSLQQAMHNPLR